MAAKVGGSKGGKYSLGQNSDINVTPFVDIMLVLLIIFMVSIPPATIAIKVDLPPTPKTQTNPNQKPVFLWVHDDGSVSVVDKPTTLETLTSDLDAALNKPNPKNETIPIQADRGVKYKDFMAVVNQLQTEGYYKVALILPSTDTASAPTIG